MNKKALAILSAGHLITDIGAIADHWGVPTAMKAIFVLPFIAFGLTWLLKYPFRK